MSDRHMAPGSGELEAADKDWRPERQTTTEHPRYSSVPSDWSVVEIREIADVVGGSTPSTAEEDYWNGDIAWATPTDVTKLSGNAIEETSRYLTEEGLSSSSTHLLPTRSVLMTSRATIGECAVTRVPMATNQGFQSLVPNERVNSWYLLYAISKIAPHLESLGSGSTFDEVSKSTVERVEVLLPPQDEQRKIASVLYTVDELITKCKSVRDRYETVKKGLDQKLLRRGVRDNGMLRARGHEEHRFQETVLGSIPQEWSVVSLGDVLSTLYRYPSYYDIDYKPHGVPEVRGNLIQANGEIITDSKELRYVSEQTASEYPRVRLQEDDFVMSVRGTIGKIGIVPASLEGAVITANLIRLQFDHDRIEPAYARHLLLSSRFQKRLDALSSRTTIKTLKARELRGMAIALPPIKEQRRIAEVLNRCREVISSENRGISRLEALKKALMQDLLTGEVRTDEVEIEVPEEVAAYG